MSAGREPLCILMLTAFSETSVCLGILWIGEVDPLCARPILQRCKSHPVVRLSSHLFLHIKDRLALVRPRAVVFVTPYSASRWSD
jgi:hypothetical protein